MKNLFGNQNVERVLYFLFLNRAGHGSEMARTLKIPLTPVQNACRRLEKEGVLLSADEGTAKKYHFNPSYPLMKELEALIKKSFLLLPEEEKKQFYAHHAENTSQNEEEILLSFWERLQNVREFLRFEKSESSPKGKGEVMIEKRSAYQMLFHEKGVWERENMQFTNLYRFTLDLSRSLLSLEHLRYGAGSPVFLFHLTPKNQKTLISMDPHFCIKDCYFGRLLIKGKTLVLNWRIIGPHKNSEIECFYY